MPSFQNIRDRLSYLYRPEDNDQSLLTTWLRAVGTVMDRMSREADDVMRSHWYPYADLASFHPYFLKRRILQNADPLVPQPSDPVVRLFPYVQDLARLGMLLPVAPWEDPPALRESVEEYRLRIRRMVEVYSRGLGTLDALRAMVEAQLPANRAASSAEQARPSILAGGVRAARDERARVIPDRFGRSPGRRSTRAAHRAGRVAAVARIRRVGRRHRQGQWSGLRSGGVPHVIYADRYSGERRDHCTDPSHGHGERRHHGLRATRGLRPVNVPLD